VTDSQLPSTWARLHPLSPVAKGGRAVLALVFITLPRQLTAEGIQPARLGVDAVIAGLIVIAGAVSWGVTRWRVEDGELQLETGLLRRQSIRVPLVRVQAVDVVRPLAARLLGMSELRLVLAGTGTGNARLAFLSEQRAIQVRAQLLALATGLPGETPEAPERPVASVPNGRLVASALLGAPVVTLLVLAGVLALVAVLSPSSVGPQVGLFATLALGPAAAVSRRLNVELNFTVAQSPDGLRLRSGLLQTRAETIPHGRVQAVRLVQPLLWRPLGWCRLEVDVAQQREREVGEEDVQQLTRALLPVGSRAEADALLAQVLPGADVRPPARSRPPRRARLKAPLSYRQLASWHDDQHVFARTGRLQAETVIVPLAKVQSIRWSQGPVQRRLRLATVHVDTAGRRWQARAADRDVEDSEELLRLLPGCARAARAALPRKGPSALAATARTSDAGQVMPPLVETMKAPS
jgi:putative membrane protein